MGRNVNESFAFKKHVCYKIDKDPRNSKIV